MGTFLDSRTQRCGPVSSESPHSKRIGRFQLQREIARGGMGIVFEAYDPDLDQSVALKVLHPWSAPDDEARFRHEARVIARLRHPGIVRVYALGRDAGRWFLVLDYIDGESLRERLERVGRLEGPEAAALLEPIARAVHYAHCRGVVHRDLKPANVLLPRIGDPLLVDFGLAKELMHTSSQPITQNGAVLGTPPYMAPEQVVGGRTIDSRTDVYGLGVTLYRALTGRHPYDGTTLEVLEQVVNAEPPRPSDQVEVDPRLEAIVLRCMAKDPARRYRTAEAVAEALARYASSPMPEVSWVSSSLNPADSTFFYGRERRLPAGARVVRRGALLPAAAALLAACAVLPLAGMLAAREGGDRDRQLGARALEPGGATPSGQRAAVSERQRLRRRGAPRSTVAGAEPEPERVPGQLRKAGPAGRVELQPPSPERIRPDAPRSHAGDRGEGARPGSLESLRDLSPQVAVALVSDSAREGVLVGLVREPTASSVAPEVSARRARRGSAERADDDPLPGLGPPLAYVDALAPPAADAPGEPDAVAQALLAWEQGQPAPSVSRPYDEVLSLDGRGPAYRAVPLQQTVGSAASAQLVPFGGVVFSGRGREVDWLLPDQVRGEVELPADVSSVAVGGGNAYVGTSGPQGSGAGDVYRRTLEGRWELSFDGEGDHALTARLGRELYAICWREGSVAEVYRLAVEPAVDPSGSWLRVATLGPERPTHAVVYAGALWVACAPSEPGLELSFYVGRGAGWGPVEIEDAGNPSGNELVRATALEVVEGNLFLAVAYTEVDSRQPDGGELLACDLGERDPEFDRLGDRLKDGDVPLSLAHHEATVYVGTLSGRLLYLTPDPDPDPDDVGKFDPEFEEDAVPVSQGIYSLLPRNNGALMLGQFGPAATEVLLRVRAE